MKIYIPLLCYNHTCNTEWMMSLIRLIMYLHANKIEAVVLPITFESLVTRARNSAVAHFMSDPAATHLLFIDSDIEFNPEEVMKLLQVNQPVVAAGYPQKWISEEKLKTILSQNPVPANPLELATCVPVHLLNNDQSQIEPVMEAEYATTGFLLIQRGVFELMMEKYPERHYMNDVDGYRGADPKYYFDFFTIMIHPITRRYESEDYGFSRLWRQIGGKIHIVTDVSLVHHGWYGFKGNIYRQAKHFMRTEFVQ